MPVISFGNGSRIDIFDDCTRIVLRDGAVVMGAPEDTDAYRATAKQTGYGDDTLALCKDHELMHLALADWLRCHSPTMQCVSQDRDGDHALRGLEEDAILSLQRYARAMNIDLIALFMASGS